MRDFQKESGEGKKWMNVDGIQAGRRNVGLLSVAEGRTCLITIVSAMAGSDYTSHSKGGGIQRLPRTFKSNN